MLLTHVCRAVIIRGVFVTTKKHYRSQSLSYTKGGIVGDNK